jgi:hypothetical protein
MPKDAKVVRINQRAWMYPRVSNGLRGIAPTYTPIAPIPPTPPPTTSPLSISLTNSMTEIDGVDATYLTARSTSTSFANGAYVGQYLYDGLYNIFRLFLKFDTSAIPMGSTITRVYMRLYLAYTNTDDGDYDIEIIKQDWSASDPIYGVNQEDVYDACLAGTKDAIWQNTSTLSTAQYYDSADLDTTWINPLGATYYSIRSSNDYNADVPAGNDQTVFYSTEDDKPPILVVEYT